MLDDAMAHLGTTDRNAVVLRFFENKSLEEVGMALGLEERAAQKRVSRALEKLRRIFGKRGVVLSAAMIAGAVSINSVQAAPAGLAAAIERLEALEPSIRPAELQAWARQFSEAEFLRKMGTVLEVESEAKAPDTQPRIVR